MSEITVRVTYFFKCVFRQVSVENGVIFFCLFLLLFPGRTNAATLGSAVKLQDRLASDLFLPDFTAPAENEKFTLPVISPPQPVPDSSSVPLLFLKDVRFSGNTVFKRDALLQVAEPYLNRLVSANDLEELRIRISYMYIDQGYVNSGAVLPDQKISNGVVHYQIVEGQLTDILITGTGWLWPGYVSSRLNGNEEDILNIQDLQEKFQLLLTDPLIKRLTGELKPGDKPGDAVLDLLVDRETPYALSLAFDNYHPPSSGSYEGVLDGRLYNLTRLGDELFLHGEVTEGAWDVSGMFAVPVSSRDTRLFLRFEKSSSSVIEESLKIIDIDSSFRSYEAGINHPLYRTLSSEFITGISLSWRRSKTWLLGETFPFSPGVESDGTASTSVVRITGEYTDRSQTSVVALRSTFAIGVSLFNSTVHSDEADSRFFAWIGQGRYGHKFDDIDSKLLLRADIQLASDMLLPMERLAVGGVYSVRGYRENELVRDNGCALSMEFRYDLYGDPEDTNHLSMQLAPFLDGGTGWNDGMFEDIEYLASGGLGLLLNWKGVHAECFLAYAFTDPVEKVDYDLQDSGIHFRLSWDLF